MNKLCTAVLWQRQNKPFKISAIFLLRRGFANDVRAFVVAAAHILPVTITKHPGTVFPALPVVWSATLPIGVVSSVVLIDPVPLSLSQHVSQPNPSTSVVTCQPENEIKNKQTNNAHK
jgi:hypothetical protein